MSNADQIEYWNGKAGERWRDEAHALDTLLKPYIDAVLKALPDELTGRVLDVGCGSGALTFAAAEKHPGVSITGIDISKPMLGLAKERLLETQANVDFTEVDASAFTAEAPFDALMSRFGVMFFADPVAAFANLRAQMREGAALSFACWRAVSENDWVMVPFQAALGFLSDTPPMPPPRAPGPFAFAEADYVTHILDSAGWNDVWVEPWDGHLTMPGETLSETAEFSLTIGPLARLIAEQDIDRDALKAALINLLEKRVGANGTVKLGAAAWIVTAKA